MALDLADLFEADPDTEIKQKANPNAGVDALLKGGYFDAEKNKPVNLMEWLFQFNNPDNSSAFAELFGGTPVTDEESPKDFNISLFSSSGSVDGVVTADSFEADMRLYVNGKLTHHCTGTKFLSHPLDDELIGTSCGCPKPLADRKKAAQAGVGPSPFINVTFRLARDYGFTVKFHTGSWSLLRVLPSLVSQVIAAGKGGEALASFEKEQVTTETRSFIVPKVIVKGAWNDAVAE